MSWRRTEPAPLQSEHWKAGAVRRRIARPRSVPRPLQTGHSCRSSSISAMSPFQMNTIVCRPMMFKVSSIGACELRFRSPLVGEFESFAAGLGSRRKNWGRAPISIVTTWVVLSEENGTSASAPWQASRPL